MSNQNLEFADKGHVILGASDTSAEGQYFSAIQVLEEATVSVADVVNSDPIVDLVLADGIVIYGVFSNITVTTGKVLVYKR